MRVLRALVWRIRSLFTSRRLDRDLRREIQSHLDEAAEEFARDGLSPEEARRAALRSFGGVTQAVETYRDMSGWPGLESIVRDVRRAIRLLRRSPAVSAAAALSLALGMGGTTTMFALLNGLVLQPLPVRAPEQLVAVIGGEETSNWKMPVWEQMRDQVDLFDGLFAWSSRSLDRSERGESQPVSALLVSGSMFDVLGLEPQIGRLLQPTDDVTGGGEHGPAAIISDRFWRREYGGAPDVVGRTLRVNGASLVVVGVAPATFFGPEVGRTFDVAVPLAAAPLLQPDTPPQMVFGNLWLSIMARLKPGHDLIHATTALHAAMPPILTAADATIRLPDQLKRMLATPRIVPAPGGPSSVRDQYAQSVTTVTAIAVLVLLIACVNLASLFVARGESRRREFAIALALGATRARLVRQLLIEGLVLSVVGALAGVAIATVAAPLLIHELSGAYQVVTLDIPVDWRLLAFTGGSVVVTTLLFGLAPALRVTRLTPNATLAGATPTGLSPRDGRMNGALVMLQVGLSLILTVSAALLVGTFVRLQHRDLGFDPAAVLSLNVSLKPSAARPDTDAIRHRSILEAVEAMPGVAAAAFANVTPMTRGRMLTTVSTTEGISTGAEREVFALDVTPGWFATMGITLRTGRDFSWNDESRRDVVVNRALARLLFDEEHPIGSTLRSPRSLHVVIGVVDDAVYRSAREGAPPTAYFLSTTAGYGGLHIRSATGDPVGLRAAAIDIIIRTDPDVLISAVPLSDVARATLAAERVTAILAGFFGVLALTLAAVGTWGVMAYGLSRRRTELAVRRALGATSANLTRHVVRRNLTIVAGGVAIGAATGVGLSGFLAPLLYGVGPRDVTTFIAAAAVLFCVAFLATWIPARRAARHDPASLLREN